MKKLLGAAIFLVTLVTGVLSGTVVRRYVVDGRSMLRAFSPGDRLLVERVSYRLRAPRVSEAVVVRQRGVEGRPDLKRIAAGPGMNVEVRGANHLLGRDEWYVLGDNMDESTDSRLLGPVKTRDVIGRVWFKY